ncbi:MAG: CaiB/BaiF CoA-transferase family protein [Pseudomonadota bacterium]
MRPLDGLLVVTIEQAIAAPYCTRLLADQGARVIKVERPDGGDFARGYDTRTRGLSSHFVWTNRSKESVTLDLKAGDDLALLKRIISQADVFVQNLAPGAADRLGLGADALRAANPRLVACSISGFGEGGPYGSRKAYDLLIQAEAGFLSVTGRPEDPAKAGISIADIAAGVRAHQAILAALILRGRTGAGDTLDISMLEALTEWMGFPLYYAYEGAEGPVPAGAGHATIFPYGPYETADGTVLFGLQNPREWQAFCDIALERPDLSNDPSLRDNAGRVERATEVNEAIAAVFSHLSTGEVMARLERANIATARVNDMAAVWAHPQLSARGVWGELGTASGSVKALKPATGAWPPRLDPVPALGAHTAAIRAEFAAETAMNHPPGAVDA